MQYIAKDACPEKKESLKNTEIHVKPGKRDANHPHVKLGHLLASTLGPLPGLVHHKTVPRAGEVLHVPSSPTVDVFPHRFANSQEVWPQTADRVFGYVRQRLADGGAKHVAAHRLVDAPHILGS